MRGFNLKLSLETTHSEKAFYSKDLATLISIDLSTLNKVNITLCVQCSNEAQCWEKDAKKIKKIGAVCLDHVRKFFLINYRSSRNKLQSISSKSLDQFDKLMDNLKFCQKGKRM